MVDTIIRTAEPVDYRLALPDPVPAIRQSSPRRRIYIRTRAWSAARRGTITLLTAALIAFLSTSICYGLLYLSPINAADEIFGDSGTPAEIHKLAVQLGTNRSYLVQYWTWLSHLLHGDLGASWFSHIPVATSIEQRLPVDLSIGGLALIFAIVLGFAGGIVAALNRGKVIDRVITSLCAVAHTIPEFWLGILLIIVFAVKFRVLPASGYVTPQTSLVQWFQYALLPAVSLCLVPAAGIARQVRTSLVGVLGENFMVGATVRGLPRRRALLRHALRCASGPAVTVIGMAIPSLLGGAVIAELVFGLPGIGQLALQGAQYKDMPVIQGVLLVLIAIVLVCNILVNIALGWLRPETKL